MQLDPTLDDGAAMPAFAETHSAVVFFVGDRAYKYKKPVDLGFLDFTSRASREQACRQELELNRRLSPDVYLGVAAIVDESGEPCEHLLVMRRMPDERRLTQLIAEGRDVSADVERIAQQVGRFHLGADVVDDPADYASTAAVRANWQDNLTTLRGFPEVIDPVVREQVGDLALDYLAGRHRLLDERIEQDRVRDGHGDLLADDIFCLDDGPRILDCLDFSARYRYSDVLLDAAFLAMDLERLGSSKSAVTFLNRWRSVTGDHYPASLAHHYIAYRAHVRAKVACLRVAQGMPAAAETARRCHDLAADHLEAGRVRLVLVGGAPGTGKTTLATGLADAIDATVLRSDEVRKELAGIGPRVSGTAGLGEGLYTPAAIDATYRELIGRATALLERGRSVVLDATWSAEGHRGSARRAADGTRADLTELCCQAPVEVAERRVASRGPDASDVTVEIVRRLTGTADPWPAAAILDTTSEPHRVVEQALGHLRAVGATAQR
jgi:uncharacterized protein